MRKLAYLVAIVLLSLVFTYGNGSAEVIRRIGDEYRAAVKCVVQSLIGNDSATDSGEYELDRPDDAKTGAAKGVHI